MGDTWVISWEKIPSSEWVVASCRVQEVALATVYRTVIMQTILGMLFLIASIVVAFFMAKSITDPLLDVDKTMEALAGGEFRHIDRFTERTDEFGGIIRNTNNVTDKLKHIVGNIISNAGTVSKESDELADTSEQISRNADDVSNAVQEIATGATQQANEIESVTENMGRIEEAVASVQRSTGDLAGIAARMQAASSESSKSLSELQNSSAAMNSAINGISDKISATSDAVERINGMVEAITSIASQTNLLALNASIEAARAGDAGRGFAVVAEEIGKLASDSSNSADQIRSEMDELLSESQAAVSMADDVQKTNMEQQKVISSTSDSVNMMISDIEETVRSVKQIEANAEACVSAKDVVVDAMSSLSAISEENAASTEETGAAMEELSATVTTLASSAGALNRISAELSEEMSFFKM
ncbi:MAG: methyl-accepting chemotaxis protein [Lachnospiraceae bacterium]|nr:methyl-accepting chemotaxis protein [Lachnospiraceae bacterium]